MLNHNIFAGVHGARRALLRAQDAGETRAAPVVPSAELRLRGPRERWRIAIIDGSRDTSSGGSWGPATSFLMVGCCEPDDLKTVLQS